MDIVDCIIRFESGEMDECEVVKFFEKLVESGHIWHLQGQYQRTAHALGLI